MLEGFVNITDYTGIFPHSPDAQAVPYRVIDTWGRYSIVDSPMFTYDVLTPSI
jgi:hypothetical protein